MKNNSKKQTIADLESVLPIIKDDPAPAAEAVSPASDVDVQEQVNRILDGMSDRVRAIMAFFGVHIVDFQAAWHTHGPAGEIVKSLSGIEIIPDVKANATSDDR